MNGSKDFDWHKLVVTYVHDRNLVNWTSAVNIDLNIDRWWYNGCFGYWLNPIGYGHYPIADVLATAAPHDIHCEVWLNHDVVQNINKRHSVMTRRHGIPGCLDAGNGKVAFPHSLSVMLTPLRSQSFSLPRRNITTEEVTSEVLESSSFSETEQTHPSPLHKQKPLLSHQNTIRSTQTLSHLESYFGVEHIPIRLIPHFSTILQIWGSFPSCFCWVSLLRQR